MANSFKEQWLDLLWQIREYGEEYSESRMGGSMMELIGASFRMLRLMQPDDLPEHANKEFCISLSQAIARGDADTSRISNVSERSLRFLEVPEQYADNVCVLYSIKVAKQRATLLAELAKPNTRRAILHICSPEDAPILTVPELGHLEYPCTLSYQLLPRNGKLHVHSFMRSQNVYLLLPLDALIASEICRSFANELGLEPGRYSASMGSAHYYLQDEPAIRRLLFE